MKTPPLCRPWGGETKNTRRFAAPPPLCRPWGGETKNIRRFAAPPPLCRLSRAEAENARRFAAPPPLCRLSRGAAKRRRLAALLLAAVLMLPMLLLSACGAHAAASMHIKRTEGTVHAADGEGRALEVRENLALYSGCRVDTEAESLAWIDLDKVKLAKLSENSAIEVQKEGKALTVEVLSGSLFFHVTEPLAEDETMEICASSMLVGIRGTCGWVTVPDAQHMELYLLEGTVECAAGKTAATVHAGEKAAMTAAGGIEVSPFTVGGIPLFVAQELADDGALGQKILDACGLDVTAHPAVVYGDAYREALSAIEGEVLFTEAIDFDADGAPELLILWAREQNGLTSVFGTVYRAGPEGLVPVGGASARLFSRDGTAHDGSLSLAASGGRLYLRCHEVNEMHYADAERTESQRNELDLFYGFAGREKGGGTDWACTEHLSFLKATHQASGREYLDEFYFRITDATTENYLSAEEYAAGLANYREVRVLAYTPDNATVVIAFGPAAE